MCLGKTAALVPNTWLDSTGLGFNTPNMLLLLQEYAHRLMLLNMTTLEPETLVEEVVFLQEACISAILLPHATSN